MRRTAPVLASCVWLSACSLLFDGSRHRNGINERADSSVPNDSSIANACDEDGDGFPRDDAACADVSPGLARDCDDSNSAIHPGAIPICNNGIDESCSGGSALGGLAIEAGTYATTSIAFPVAVDRPSRLRIFGLEEPGEALAFFLSGGVDRAPRIANVALNNASHDSSLLSEHITFPDISVRGGDAIRRNDGRIFVGVLGQHGDDLHVVHTHYDPRTSEWQNAQNTVQNASEAGFPSFTPFGQIGLIEQPHDVASFAVAATTPSLGNPGLFALGVGSNGIEFLSSTSTVAPERPWIESSGEAVGYPDADGNLRFWNGALGGIDTDHTRSAHPMPLAVPLTGPASVIAVRGSGERNRLVFVAPISSGLTAITIGCADNTSMIDCQTFVPGPDSPTHYALSLAPSPRVDTMLLSSTALGLAYPIEENGGRMIRLGVLETGPLAMAILQLPYTFPYEGELFDISLDGSLIPDTTTEEEEDGTIVFFVAWATERGVERQIQVAGIRACFGYTGF